MTRAFFLGSIISGAIVLASQACNGTLDLPPATSPDAGATEAGPAQGGGPGTSLGTVTFRMTAPSNASSYSYLASFGDPGDGIWWYSVETADGGPIEIFQPSDLPTCEPCASTGIPFGYTCNTLPDAGVTATWDGLSYPAATSTCGGNVCQVTTYVPEGEYVVTMCAGCPEDSPDGGQQCLNVPFHYPTSTEIVGTL